MNVNNSVESWSFTNKQHRRCMPPPARFVTCAEQQASLWGGVVLQMNVVFRGICQTRSQL